MTECLKNPGALIDAEALASHVSVAGSTAANVDAAKGKSNTNSSKSGAKDSKKMKSS